MFYDLSMEVDAVVDQTRREVVAMALQLGYTSIASNHIHTGIMADSDRSKIKPLNISSVLAASAAVAESTKFHQSLLGVPPGRPFRQYNRITVVVDDVVQAGALNSANPVLRSYDIVAVRPTNQRAFNQACTHLEVDVISIDFYQRLPFRMKAPMVKAAIERGVFFEISYGRALCDARARRELFANGQVLQTLTRGRGIILSSGARQALEVRGPNDVANLATLFGLSLEVAKAAVSKNCKSVVLHGVARKSTFKAAILIDRVPPIKTLESDRALFDISGVWDPLSVGTAKGASVDLSKLLQETSKQADDTAVHATAVVARSKSSEDGLSNQGDEKKVDELKERNSTSSVIVAKDETFISMVSASSEWTEVKKRGKNNRRKGQKGPGGGDRDVHNIKTTKKRKFI